jgi:hypothetical protein
MDNEKIKCDKCNKIFDFLCQYKRHINNKNPCVKIPYNICTNCNKMLSKKTDMTKHMKICTKKNNTNLQNVINETQNNIIINNGTINNITNNITNNINIQIINFSETKIDTTKIKDLMNDNDFFEKIIADTHLNPEKSNYHNILVSDLVRNKLKLYEDNRWQCKDKKNIYFQLLLNTNESIGKIKNDLNDEQMYKYKFFNEKTIFCEKGIKNKLDKINEILYNNSDIVLKTKNKKDKEQIQKMKDEK